MEHDFAGGRVAQSPQPTGIMVDTSGKYRWVCELPMLKSLFLLLEVWKVLGLAALAVALISMAVSLLAGGGGAGVLGTLKTTALVLGILLVLSLPAYLIVTKANNGKYTVLFEMDDSGIDHIQIKTDAAKALNALVIFTGLAAGNRTTTAAGLLSAGGGSLYSRFSRVRRVTCVPGKRMIALSSSVFRNQVYTTEEDFAFVRDFILQRCTGAKVTTR